jgi:reactive chlorine resistance protein C
MERSKEIYYNIGIGILRYGLVGLLLLWGSFKFFAFEANAIQPLVGHSPLLGWLLPVFGLRTTSGLLGVFEVGSGLLIGLRHWFPRLSAYGSLAATAIFATTLSFLVTTPGALSISSPFNGFLLKDIMFLGGALVTAAEAFTAEYADDIRMSQIPIAIR